MNQPRYLPDADYDRLVLTVIAGLVPSFKIEPSPWSGRIEADDVKIALGEQFDIWPERIIPYMDPEDRPASH